MILGSENETNKFAEDFAKDFKNGGVVLLFGDLGTGKTTFTKAFAKFFGVETIKSPTYNYIRKYDLKNRSFYHVDLYRLESIDDLLLREIEEIVENPANIVVIEWADKLQNKLKAGHKSLRIEYLDENSRNITVIDD